MPYLNVNEVESALQFAAGPPNAAFTDLFALPNLTWEGRQCHGIKIANGAGPSRPGVYFLGGVHAREWGSPDILVNLVEVLTGAYRNNTGLTFGSKTFSSTDIQRLVNELDVIVFPQANPDGRNYSMTVDPLWRRNRRSGLPGGASCQGVDVNRNYDFLWDFPTFFNPAAGIVDSTDPCDLQQTYHGPAVFSEPEAQNAAWVMDSFPNIRLFVDLHSFSQDILYSWGDDQDQSTSADMNFMSPAYNGQRGVSGDAYREYIPSCDLTTCIDLANALHDGIVAYRGTAYTVKSAFDLYPTAGTSDDYAYSRHFADLAKEKVLAYTLEWGNWTGDAATSFHPPYSEMQNIIQEVTSGLIQMSLKLLDLRADTYIRDNLTDTGATPFAGVFWESPDIVIRAADDGVMTNLPVDVPNFLYVRFANLGPNPSRDVRVTVRAVRYPGTEFVYPQDWTLTDIDHIAPAVLIDSFSGVAPGDSRVAKFSFSASQISAMVGWQSTGAHPCILACVDGRADFTSRSGPHVWENNNLGQRNVTVINAIREESIRFPFVVGNRFSRDRLLELEVIRHGLPDWVNVGIRELGPLVPSGQTRGRSGWPTSIEFPERTRVTLLVEGTRAELELAPGTSLAIARNSLPEITDLRGGVMTSITEPLIVGQGERTVVTLLTAQSSPQVLALEFNVPSEARAGDTYRIRVSQKNPRGIYVGGVTLEVHVIGGPLGQ